MIALYAFDHELARAPQTASNPHLAEIRLSWWGDVLTEIFTGARVRTHEVTGSLATAVRRRDVPRELLEAVIEARVQALGADRVPGEIEAAGPLTEAAALALDPNVDRPAASLLGRRWRAAHAGVADPASQHDTRRAARRISTAAFPAVAHAALLPEETSELARRLRLTWAVARGRL